MEPELADARRAAPLISLVTVNLNNSDGLERTIASINCQTYGHWTHLIQDGGSSDASVSICDEYPDSRRSLVSESDGGIYDGMNRGLARAPDGLVWFLNSGDTLATPVALRAVADAWVSSEWLWAVGGVRIERADGQPASDFLDPSATAEGVLRGYTMFPHPATVYQAQFVKDLGGFYVGVGPAADQDLAVRAYHASRPLMIAEILACFEAGGVSEVGVVRHQRRLRQLRSANQAMVLGSPLGDALWTTARILQLGAKHLLRDIRGARARGSIGMVDD